jgi:uncharacterized Zn-binding protein involved in type VI secretion
MEAFVCKGDKTSHGGVVLEGFDELVVEGKWVAGVNHKVSCPQCKGEFRIVDGSSQVMYRGRSVAVEGMKTACGAVLLAGQHDHGIVAQGGGGVASQARGTSHATDAAECAAGERQATSLASMSASEAYPGVCDQANSPEAVTLCRQWKEGMTKGTRFELEIDSSLKEKASGLLNVSLHKIETGVRICSTVTGELVDALWLPWKQGNLATLQPFVHKSHNKSGMPFLTSYLSGCKVFAIRGGPIWHIDAMVSVQEFWPKILNSDWVEDHWEDGGTQEVAYLHRAGQDRDLWDLSAYLDGAEPSTYGEGNLGAGLVGGIVDNDQRIDLYLKVTLNSRSSEWAPLRYATQLRKSNR